MRQEKDNRVARRLLGHYINGDYKEIIQIEYRYAPKDGFSLYTQIQGHEYQFSEHKFFGVMAGLLDQLPISSSLVISHQVIVLKNDVEKIGMLEEWLSPYEGSKPTDTVVYQLKLLIEDDHFETSKYTTSGYARIDFGSVAEDLRNLLGIELKLKVCYFCKYLVEYNDFGGTDYRHDQLFCFRDSPETLSKIMEVYPTLGKHKSLLDRGTPDMDALHSCDAFTYREQSRP